MIDAAIIQVRRGIVSSPITLEMQWNFFRRSTISPLMCSFTPRSSPVVDRLRCTDENEAVGVERDGPEGGHDGSAGLC